MGKGGHPGKKAAKIRDLYAQGCSTRTIAERILGLSPDAEHAERDRRMAYVRAVCRQRGEHGYSDAQTRYLLRRFGGASVMAAKVASNRYNRLQRRLYPATETA